MDKATTRKTRPLSSCPLQSLNLPAILSNDAVLSWRWSCWRAIDRITGPLWLICVVRLLQFHATLLATKISLVCAPILIWITSIALILRRINGWRPGSAVTVVSLLGAGILRHTVAWSCIASRPTCATEWLQASPTTAAGRYAAERRMSV